MELPSSGLEELVDNEDYYSLLNASRQATGDELKNSYRRLCMVYHPDKHSDVNSKDASAIFGKIHTAYSVLSDPAKRHIYDVYGKKGLDADWQIVERRKTPAEMEEEYNRLQRLRAQHRLNERTQPKGTFSMTVNATSLFDEQEYSNDDYYDQPIIIPDITKVSVTQSVEAPLTISQTATLSGGVESTNGNGSGNLNLGLRKTLSSKSWGELELGVTDSKQFNCSLKAYRTLGGGLFALVHFPCGMLIDNGVAALSLPGANLTIGRMMGQHLYGTMDLSVGSFPSLSTSIVHDSERYRLSGKIQLGIPHSFMMSSLTYRMPDIKTVLKLAIKAGTFGCMVQYGAEHEVSQHSVISANVSVGVPLGVTLKLKLNRASQNFHIPILLSDDFNILAVFYGTVVPMTAYIAVQKLIIKPYKQREKERLEEENEQSLINETNQKRDEAFKIVNMMRASTERKADIETQRFGLIIIEAWYGRFVSEQSAKDSKLVDVTIPVQNLVENSNLQLPADIGKSGLPGFFDPCPGSDKKLKVTYKFRNALHRVTIDDKDALRIPLRSHSVEE